MCTAFISQKYEMKMLNNWMYAYELTHSWFEQNLEYKYEHVDKKHISKYFV